MLASTASTGTAPRDSGELAAKQFGQQRLQERSISSRRMQVCWVCISPSPRR